MTNFAEVSNADLISELIKRGLVVKAWSREDVVSYIEDLEHEYSPSQVEAIADEAINSSAFSSLADCTDGDWEAVSQAVTQGIEDLKLPLKI